MCMIGLKMPGTDFPDELLEAAADSNRDGFGFMYAKDDKLHVHRSMNMGSILKVVKQIPTDAPAAVHCRIGTHGERTKENCHPFRIIDGLYLMHNGILPLKDPDNKRSDTALFATYLRRLLEPDPSLFMSEEFRVLVRMAIEAGYASNKLLFMRNDGEVWVVNYDAGYDYGDIWISSNPFSYVRTTPSTPSTPSTPYVWSGKDGYQKTDSAPSTSTSTAATSTAVSEEDPKVPTSTEPTAEHVSDDGPESTDSMYGYIPADEPRTFVANENGDIVPTRTLSTGEIVYPVKSDGYIDYDVEDPYFSNDICDVLFCQKDRRGSFVCGNFHAIQDIWWALRKNVDENTITPEQRDAAMKLWLVLYEQEDMGRFFEQAPEDVSLESLDAWLTEQGYSSATEYTQAMAGTVVPVVPAEESEIEEGVEVTGVLTDEDYALVGLC